MKDIIIAHIFLNRKCNLNCSYCALVKDDNELTLEQWKNIFLTLKPHVHTFNIAGLEPTLTEYLEDLIVFWKQNNINYVICTHGLVSDEKLKKYIDLGLKGIGVSIDSVHRRFIDRSSEIKSKRGIEVLNLLSEYDDISKFIGITVSKLNIHEVFDIITLADKHEFISCVTPIQKEREGRIFAGGNEHCFTINDCRLLFRVKEKLISLYRNGTLLGECEEIYDMWIPQAWEQSWKCEPMSVIMVDNDGRLGCCYDYYGKNVGSINIVKDGFNLQKLHDYYESDLKECGGCLWGCNVLSTLVKEGKIPIEVVK